MEVLCLLLTVFVHKKTMKAYIQNLPDLDPVDYEVFFTRNSFKKRVVVNFDRWFRERKKIPVYKERRFLFFVWLKKVGYRDWTEKETEDFRTSTIAKLKLCFETEDVEDTTSVC